MAAEAVREGEVGEAEVGAVEDHHRVGVEELHVHGHNADALLEDLPVAAGGGGFRRGEENYMKEEERSCFCCHCDFMGCEDSFCIWIK